jgi:hypothetical protein
MFAENSEPTGAMESVTSATVTAGCSENTLHTMMATIGASTFIASRATTSREGLLRTYGKSAGARRMPTASTPRKMLRAMPRPISDWMFMLPPRP